MIKTLADVYALILEEIFDLLLPIIIFVLIITFIKIMTDYIKYGKKVFSVFNKKGARNISKESLNVLFKNLNVYYKTIEFDNNIIVLILECGIYILYVLDYDGIITGDISKTKLILGENTQSEKMIDNPVYILKNQITEIKNKTGHDASGYILSKSNCIFSVLNRTDIKLISFNAFHFHFSKLINNKKMNFEEVDRVYERIA